MRKFLHSFVFVVTLLPAIGVADQEQAKRELFLEAYRALGAGKTVDVEATAVALGDYVLTPYLRYQALRRRLEQASPAQVEAFLRAHGDLAVAEGLRREYLGVLGKRGEWRSFLSLYRPTNALEPRCYRLLALRASGSSDDAWRTEARQIWQSSRQAPQACERVFEALRADGGLAEAEVWRRALAAMEAGDTKQVKSLKPWLGQQRQALLDQWLAVAAKPTLLQSSGHTLAAEIAPQAVRTGLRRLAASEPRAAWELLPTLAKRYRLNEAEQARLRRDVAIRAAWSQEALALTWLEALPESVVDDEVRLWRARLTLLGQDWVKLLAAIDALPASVQAEAQWRYWRGYALDASGRGEEAAALLGELARERNYYGFLAADHLHIPYSFNHRPLRFDEAELALLEADVGIQRARELFRVGLRSEATGEWRAALARLDGEQRARAAVLALKWQWYDRAVLTANEAGLDDALDLRFPTPFREQVERYSRMHRLDPAVVYAILRKESAFRTDAVSPAGALGLMQVMPRTGATIARELKLKAPGRDGLLDPDTNLRFGSYYLSSMLERYDGNLVLAAAAYNAGPHRVSKWVERLRDVPPTVWIEGISFAETRDYVKSVLAFRAVFDWQLYGKTRRITEYLQPLDEALACRVSGRERC